MRVDAVTRRAGILFALLLAACATPAPLPAPKEPPRPAEEGPAVPLTYYQLLHRMTPQEIGRERIVLAALPASPALQVRLAILAAHPRGQNDLARALAHLEPVLKSTDPAAVSLHPLARLLTDQYSERQKLERQAETASQQLKDTQRRAGELQEKLDALTDIERSLPTRSRAGGGR